MALTITDANVGIGGPNTAISSPVQLATTLTRMVPVYRVEATGKYAACNTTTATLANCVGVTFSGAATDGYAVLATRGPVIVGATLTAGEVYAVSSITGLIEAIGDLSTGDYVTILGTAISTTVLDLNVQATGIQRG